MSPWFHAHVMDGRVVVCSTTDGLDHSPVKGPVFKGPRQAIDFAVMRNQHISPLRSSVEPSDPSLPEGSTEQPRGRSSGSGGA